MRPAAIAAACLLLLSATGCGRSSRVTAPSIRTIPRRTVVWVGASGADRMTVEELKRAGVDELAVRRGSVELGAGIPVVRAQPAPAVADGLPTAAVLTLVPEGDRVDPEAAEAVWRALARELGEGSPPRELLVELPRTAEHLDELVARLANVSGLPTVPVLAVSQIADPLARAAARRAGSCVVVALGQTGLWRRGAGAVVGPLRDALAPLAATGTGVRIAVVAAPRTEPPVSGWGDELDPLTEPENAEILGGSTLERSFRLLRPLSWSGRRWKAGDTVALAWTDAAELDAALSEASHLTVPVLVGWDLLWLPPAADSALGLGRNTLLAYLDGEGPAPRLEVKLERSGGFLRVVAENRTPFCSAVSKYGNWVEVDTGGTALVAEDRGGFDGIVLGSRRSGSFKRTSGSSVTAVRFLENYIAPGEDVRSGRIRLANRRVQPTVRWHIQLSDGREITSVLPPAR